MLKESLIECGAIQFGEFTLTSGKKSKYYVDIKRASTNPKILKEIAVEMSKIIGSSAIKFDVIGGMELGAVPLAAALALETGIPYVMIRKQPREHGTQNQIVGELSKGSKAVVVEDVATTGGSIAKSIEVLQAEHAEVKQVLVVVDREEGARELLEKYEVELTPLVRASELF
ncbi:MAG: orotate phosphoribosyltransferase [Thermoplasmata archaeon]|nr:orotate phosphoribosyltransferase [Thermoplasmata archaeon]